MKKQNAKLSFNVKTLASKATPYRGEFGDGCGCELGSAFNNCSAKVSAIAFF